MGKTVRLQKMLAHCGVASRRKAEELIEKGAVKVNGVVAHLGDKVDPKQDKVTLHNRRVVASDHHIYVMLHKPRGFVTTLHDERGRKCIAQLITDVPGRVYPVGRLDKDSEGLLLLTNDGEFANQVTHPSNHMPKTYRVTVRPDVSEEQLTRLCTGVMVDGRQTAPAEVFVLQRGEGKAVLQFVLREGRNRQIRKMCEEVGLEVARLKRMAIGPVKMGFLQPGKWRYLTPEEIKKLGVTP